jgi:hypothetical protein
MGDPVSNEEFLAAQDGERLASPAARKERRAEKKG